MRGHSLAQVKGNPSPFKKLCYFSDCRLASSLYLCNHDDDQPESAGGFELVHLHETWLVASGSGDWVF